jgi:Protein NO VEIN, C-terminal
VAIEAHAMNMAGEFYGTAWAVQDVHGGESYDLICRRGDEVKHVEVKGTTTNGEEVILTPTRSGMPGRTRTQHCSSSATSWWSEPKTGQSQPRAESTTAITRGD